MATRLLILRSDRTSVRLPYRLTKATASPSPFAGSLSSPKATVMRLLRALGPVFLSFTIATAAHAQGTMDFSGAQTLMGTFKTFAVYAGAVICFGGLIFAGIRMMSGRFQDAIPGLFGALFGAGVLGWGAGWIGSLTGQSM
jgi:hypothetical protein